ncbi:MAG TPA: hypothetical protein VKB31_01350 [Trueperaceae bacterium]|nr:hypothetical protein [Trueperaceae bacterium]
MTRLREKAEASHVSLSSLAASVLERELDDAWPDAVAAMAGAWPDFPVRGELPPLPDDPRRQPFT